MPFISRERLTDLERVEAKYDEHKEEMDSLKATHKDKLKELRKEHASRVERLEDEAHKQKVKHDKLETDNKALESLRADTVKTQTKLLELDEREKKIKAREDVVTKREKDTDVEDSKKYKSGYEDGVADGLRRGYDLTADDRQNMASIAALAAASHSDGATQKIAEEIVLGMEKTRNAKALPAGSKKKS